MNCDRFDREWYQVIIRCPALSAGGMLGDLLEELVALGVPNLRYAVLSGIEGAGNPVEGITQIGCAKVTIPDLLRRLRFSDQLDWANFFFFTDIDDRRVAQICTDLSIPDAIALSTLAMRVVDDSELHLFTTSQPLTKVLTDRYVDSSVEVGSLSRLSYPS